MAKIKIAALLVAAGVLYTGCSVFFDFNAFAGLDTPPAPALADYQGVNGLSNLAADLDSPAVVAQLIDDPATVTQVKDYLQTTFLSGALTTPDQQTAAVLYSDLSLKTTSGDTLVNNLVTTIMSDPAAGNISSIITSVVPQAVLADPAAFTAMIEGLLDAKAAYESLGTSIGTYGAPGGVNLGDVAQKAAVAWMIWSVVDAVKTQAPPDTDAEAEAEMYKLATSAANTISGVTIADPLNPMPAWLQSIFDAAGVPNPA